MGKIKKSTLTLALYLAFRFITIIAFIFSLYNNNFLVSLQCLLVLFLLMLPSMLAKRWQIELPNTLEIIIIAFIFASIFLGEIRSFYMRYWWWDSMLHCISGFVIGAIGFSLVNLLNKSKSIVFKLEAFFISLFSFCFAMAIGALWEVFEYFMDQTFGFNMQKTGLQDTMWDLIIDAIGAFVFSFFGYFYLKGKYTFLEKFLWKPSRKSKESNK